MEIFISDTNINRFKLNAINSFFKRNKIDDSTYVFIGYPTNDKIIDAVLISKTKGVSVFEVVEEKDENQVQEKIDDLIDNIYLIKNKLETNREIRNQKLNIKGCLMIKDCMVADKIPEEFIQISEQTSLVSILPNCAIETDLVFNKILKIISGLSAIEKPERDVPERFKGKKIDFIREIEKQIQNYEFDADQVKIAHQIPPGPQRIRGLAGTGKTIVLTMKIAYMHFLYPEWDLVYTFNTQSLYGQIENLITRFYSYISNGNKPNYEKIKILHGWGGAYKEGLYSFVSNYLKVKPRDYRNAKDYFEFKRQSEILGNCCEELIEKYPVPEMFDAILIDEAQDFDYKFLRFCRSLLKPPKRLVWAYDELQSLEEVSIPTAVDIFGTDVEGRPIVDLDGVYEDGIEKDFILLKSYRNPGVVLFGAHFFGMGIFRKKGAIQIIPSKDGWEDIGYIVNGSYVTDQYVQVTRPLTNSPNMLEDLDGRESILKVFSFNSKQDELDALCESIKKNIENEGIRPEDIIVIGMPHKDLFKKIFPFLKVELKKYGINSIIAGHDSRADEFRLPNFVTLSTVYKAKGNESSLVYVINFEKSESEAEIIKFRNMAFTSITRSKGWCYIYGTGEEMSRIKTELSNIVFKYPRIEFKVPDKEKIKRYLDNIEYEKRRKRIKRAEVAIRKILLEDESVIRDLPKELKETLARSLKEL